VRTATRVPDADGNSSTSPVVSLARFVSEVPASSSSAKCAQGTPTRGIANRAARHCASYSADLLGSGLAGTSADANSRCQY
jgi:hypothetical protein